MWANDDGDDVCPGVSSDVTSWPSAGSLDAVTDIGSVPTGIVTADITVTGSVPVTESSMASSDIVPMYRHDRHSMALAIDSDLRPDSEDVRHSPHCLFALFALFALSLIDSFTSVLLNRLM